ncbi:MAG: peptide deformylase [Chitinispirillaceae bacterium]|nr:peptide deformylase [Chitinispirillaceae bacterium]
MNAKSIRMDPAGSIRQLQLRVLPDPVLREICAEVETFDKGLQAFTKRMLAFMKKAKGIGLAAPQVGILLRIAVVGVDGPGMILVNPSIMPMTIDSDTKTEGCLSIPNATYNITRLFQVEVRARNAEGKKLNFAAHGLLARVIQHEIDHLDGVLICDKETGGIGRS